jgi:hypothetical protein
MVQFIYIGAAVIGFGGVFLLSKWNNTLPDPAEDPVKQDPSGTAPPSTVHRPAQPPPPIMNLKPPTYVYPDKYPDDSPIWPEVASLAGKIFPYNPREGAWMTNPTDEKRFWNGIYPDGSCGKDAGWSVIANYYHVDPSVVQKLRDLCFSAQATPPLPLSKPVPPPTPLPLSKPVPPTPLPLSKPVPPPMMPTVPTKIKNKYPNESPWWPKVENLAKRLFPHSYFGGFWMTDPVDSRRFWKGIYPNGSCGTDAGWSGVASEFGVDSFTVQKLRGLCLSTQRD